MSNVMTWRYAIENGYEPREYPYAAAYIPLGEYEAVLEFKTWSKRAFTMSCYFTALLSRQKFQLSVFKRNTDHVYGLKDGVVDFRECPVHAVYKITVSLNAKDKAVLEKATLIRLL